jgi:pyruvate dehydrogenase E2 component (dihydrolipoamide acetyltransferase)
MAMAIEVKVPDIGDFSEIPVVTVLVAVGDSVAVEDPLIELESDKATMEVPSSSAGRVKEILVAEGDKVSEGSLILILEGDAGGGSDVDPSQKKATEKDKDKEEVSGKADAETADRSDGTGGGQPGAPAPYAAAQSAQHADAAVVTDAGHGKVHASPSVRAFARTVDVDLTRVNGTGRKGRILREDVMKAVRQAAPAGGGGVQGGMGIPPIPAVDFSKFGPVEDVEMTRIQKLSGPALHRSWLNIPHVTHNDDADITDLDAYRKELDTAAKAEGYRVTLLAFVVKACVSALRTHWQLNSSVHPDGDKLIRKDYCNIGFAADTPNGLMVPVIKDADRKGIVEI